MAIHEYTGIRARVTADPDTLAIVGFVEADVTVDIATGKYNELDSKTSKAHTRGLVSVSGTLKKAWGISSDKIWTWLKSDLEYTLHFDPKGGETDKTVVVSGCVLTSVAIEGIEAGGDGALLLNCPFEGLDWDSDEIA